jgi:SprT protein
MKRVVNPPNSRVAKSVGLPQFPAISIKTSVRNRPPLNPERLTREVERTLEDLAVLWRMPNLREAVKVQFSSRLRRSVGRAFPKSGIIRLHLALTHSKQRRLLRTALCHEAAHVAVQILHGPKARPHGTEWRSLLKSAGYRPSTTVKCSHLSLSDTGNATPKLIFRYICPVCQGLYMTRKKDSRFRCGHCLKAGLGGRLRQLF